MIESLSYIGFTSPNAAAWNTFGPEVHGLELTHPGPDGTVRLRNDDAPYRIAVHPDDVDDLAYLGWAVAGPAELADAVAHLAKHDIEVRPGDAELAELRAVTDVAWFTDPFGFRHELTHGRQTGPAFAPGRPISGSSRAPAASAMRCSSFPTSTRPRRSSSTSWASSCRTRSSRG